MLICWPLPQFLDAFAIHSGTADFKGFPTLGSDSWVCGWWEKGVASKAPASGLLARKEAYCRGQNFSSKKGANTSG